PAQQGTYWYRVQSFNVAGASDYTNIVQVDVPAAPPGPPGAVGPNHGPRTVTVSVASLIGNRVRPGSEIKNLVPLDYNSPNRASTMDVPGTLPPVPQASLTSSMSSMTTKVATVELSDNVRGDLGPGRLPGFSSPASMNALDELFALDMLELF
ncbi:MAG TPA: hypothetical protein VKU02_03865, partial [Gemmataceae bacterium]|nr:hypothetical protein [Gemmataceae bacterium]